jgi:hypothetical protein
MRYTLPRRARGPYRPPKNAEGGATAMSSKLRSRLSFANVTSVLALFIALGGTGYAAITLPANSVGSKQIRGKAVGTSELRRGAVRSSDIRDRSVRLRDISTSARTSLRGQTGPQGPPGASGVTLRAAVPAGGTVQRGNATSAAHVGGTNEYRVTFAQDITTCVATATLATVSVSGGADQPAAGRITVNQDQATSVLVRTFGADGAPAEQPFNLVVAC